MKVLANVEDVFKDVKEGVMTLADFRSWVISQYNNGLDRGYNTAKKPKNPEDKPKDLL